MASRHNTNTRSFTRMSTGRTAYKRAHRLHATRAVSTIACIIMLYLISHRRLASPAVCRALRVQHPWHGSFPFRPGRGRVNNGNCPLGLEPSTIRTESLVLKGGEGPWCQPATRGGPRHWRRLRSKLARGNGRTDEPPSQAQMSVQCSLSHVVCPVSPLSTIRIHVGARVLWGASDRQGAPKGSWG